MSQTCSIDSIARTLVTAATNHSATSPASSQSLPDPARRLVANGEYAKAYDLLQTLPHSTYVRNAMAVCAIRSGRIDQAISIYRDLLLIPGTTILRKESPDLLKVNFAIAVLLKGLPSGALDILDEVKDPIQISAVRVKSAIRQWSNSLSFWRRWDWKINRIDPVGCQVPIELELGNFELGEFYVAVQTSIPKTSVTPKPTAPKLAA
nr:hypothetical protein [uncultured bacterium]